MATPSKTPQPELGYVPVKINTDPKTKKITVSPDPFEVSKGNKEQVQWICGQNHDHNNPKGCFWIHFDKESPFDKKEFRKHMELSSPPNDASVIEKKYKYSVDIDGYPTLDPIGVVKP